MIPIPPRADKSKGSKQYVLPEPILEEDLSLRIVKQETQEVAQGERQLSADTRENCCLLYSRECRQQQREAAKDGN